MIELILPCLRDKYYSKEPNWLAIGDRALMSVDFDETIINNKYEVDLYLTEINIPIRGIPYLDVVFVDLNITDPTLVENYFNKKEIEVKVPCENWKVEYLGDIPSKYFSAHYSYFIHFSTGDEEEGSLRYCSILSGIYRLNNDVLGESVELSVKDFGRLNKISYNSRTEVLKYHPEQLEIFDRLYTSIINQQLNSSDEFYNKVLREVD